MKKNLKLIHIGTGKTASTTLQKIVFPKLAKYLNIQNINLNELICNDEIKFHILENEQNFHKKLPNQFIISNEGLFSRGWEFNKMKKSFEILKRNFTEDTHVIIFIRKPYDFLNSIYIQSLQELKIIEPKNFFYDDVTSNKDGYNLRDISYKDLIYLYKSYFKKVDIIKFEKILDLNFLDKIENLSDEFKLELKRDVKNNVYNKSFSNFSVKLILLISKIINLKDIDNLIALNIKETNNFFGKIRNKFLNLFLIRNIFQNFIDKVVPYRKYLINSDYIPLDLKKLEKEYDEIS